MAPIEVFIPGYGSTGKVPEAVGERESLEKNSDGTPVFTVKISGLKRKGPNSCDGVKSITMEVVPLSRGRPQKVRFNGRSHQFPNPEAEITFPGGENTARVIYHRK